MTASNHLLCELRRYCGLSWDEVAVMFGVPRADVYRWASGEPVSPPEQEARLRALHDVLTSINAPSDEVRAAFLRRGGTPASPEELRDALTEAGAHYRRAPKLRPLDEAAQAARRPPPPAERIVEELCSPHPVAVGRTRRPKRK